MSRILVAEDEPRIASFLSKGLRASGFDVEVADDGEVAARLARDEDFDLLLLDLGLPGREGLDVLAEIRDRGDRLPIIILTADDEVDTTVRSLDLGADDYITKPFVFEELAARIRARLRSGEPSAALTIEAGAVVLDVRSRTISVDGVRHQLTAREYALAEVLLGHQGEALPRDELLAAVWPDEKPGSNVLDVYILYLRRKIGAERIQTVRGVGYSFVPAPDPA